MFVDVITIITPPLVLVRSAGALFVVLFCFGVRTILPTEQTGAPAIAIAYGKRDAQPHPENDQTCPVLLVFCTSVLALPVWVLV